MYDHEGDGSFENDVVKNISSFEAPTAEAVEVVPGVRGVNQKGSGLITLKKALSILTDPGPKPPLEGYDGSEEEREKAFAYERQERLENECYESAIERWRSENAQLRKLGINNALKQGTIGSLLWTWQKALVPLVEEEVRKSNEAEQVKTRNETEKWRGLYGPYLQFLPPEKVSAITILTCMSVMSMEVRENTGTKVAVAVEAIGQAIQDESIAESIRNNSKHNYWQGLSRHEHAKRLTNMIKKRQIHDSLMKLVAGLDNLGPSSRENLEWSTNVKARIGAVLLSHLLEVAKVEVTCQNPETGSEIKELQPVFFHTYRYLAGKSIGVIRYNQAMVGKLSREPVASTLAKYLPMVVEPKPWTGYKKGGFLQSSTGVIRQKQSDRFSQRYAIAASQNGDMAQVFAGLDVLARTPWKINRPVFDVMIEAWNTGEAIAKIPPENPKIDYPTEPAPSDGLRVRQRWYHRMREIDNQHSGMKSERCFQNFQLEVARAFLNEEFYFPHNVDFRGRAYPMSPLFNHMAADNCRGLLTFAKGKELGPYGLKWLKIQVASLFGFDKASFGEREKFTDNHLPEIYDSATKAMNGKRWWLKADDPWQCLAACIELRNALESPDPQQHVSHLPIHQDGTCNGLQHYAALGGDPIGAKQVNLEPGDRPSDIYTTVAEMVKAEISEEAAQGSEMARLLDGRLTRKIVKQPVMTNVYGVTFRGARAQVLKQLEEAFTDFPNTMSINRLLASSYIAHKIFKSLSDMFKGAHDLQHWLATCAIRISNSLSPEQLEWVENEAGRVAEPSKYRKKPVGGRKRKPRQETSFRTPVIWTTPLKMPVVQPYRGYAIEEVMTNLQKIHLSVPSSAQPIDKRKQLQGFPPNFIHSLDATHMILSALKSDEAGLTFAAVHDSFWTHAADVHVMNRILRDAFIRMHSEDIIGRLAAEFAARYKGSMYLAYVNCSSALGRKIKAYRKSKGQTGTGGEEEKHAELVQERRRLKLLASDSPKEREEGEAMVTAGRIYAENTCENDPNVVENLDEIGIGHIPAPRSAKSQANKETEAGDIDHIKTHEDKKATAVDGADIVENVENVGLEKENQKKKKGVVQKLWVWVPLTFPPVPKKVCFLLCYPYRIRVRMLIINQGEFDISRLRDSQYFFS